MESDVQFCVQAITDPNYRDYSAFGLLIDNCKSLMLKLREICLYFVRRSTNNVAHSLA